jgi:CRISPR/Cas system-associated exonuclease Cas4 (RecB family)
LKNKTGVAGMIANPVILGKLMHEIVQNHLLNKKHFRHKDYVEEVAQKQMAETEANLLQEGAARSREHLYISATMGYGTAVTPDAQELCYKADDARHRANGDKYGSAYTGSLFASRTTALNDTGL